MKMTARIMIEIQPKKSECIEYYQYNAIYMWESKTFNGFHILTKTGKDVNVMTIILDESTSIAMLRKREKELFIQVFL